MRDKIKRVIFINVNKHKLASIISKKSLKKINHTRLFYVRNTFS